MSASPLWQQEFLDLGERAHFDLQHGLHRANITIATKNGENFRSTMHEHATASALAFDMQGDVDAYISQNGFSGQRRLSTEVAALTSCFVDVDAYNIAGLAGLTFGDLRDRMRTAYPWLPPPTTTISSGRGFYLHWVLRAPLPREKLPRWSAVQNALVAALAAIGADANAKDAARVLRIVGTINSKSGETVVARRTGEIVAFETFERLVLTHALPAQPAQQCVVPAANDEIIVRLTRTASPAQRRQYLAPFQLAYDRLQDFGRIALLRGSPQMQDHRERLLFYYTASGAWFWSDREAAEDEIVAFAQQHFADADRYTPKLVRSTLDRMEAGKLGVRDLYDGVQVNRRYRLRNQTLITGLAVSPAEQRGLQTIIGPAEKQNRRVARRREAGMVDYAARTERRVQMILEGLDGGRTQAAMAAELGISRQAVSGLLRQRKPATV